MRAQNSGISLTERDAAIVKAMLRRGDRQHDIAAWFGVNGGRIGEIASGKRHKHVEAAENSNLPPPGPYPNGRDATIALRALVAAQQALAAAESVVREYAR